MLKRERVGVAALFVTWLIFFGRILTGHSVYFLDDLKIIYYPLETAYATFQGAWQLPLWSPLFGFGQPLLGWAQLGFFTPLHVVLRAAHVAPLTLLQISVLFYFLGGLLGFYLFLRRHQFLPPAAALGAILYCFNGFNIGHLNHVNFYVSTMLLPWMLLAIDYHLRRSTLRSSATLALAIGSSAISGQPQIVLYTTLIAALYGTCSFVALRPSWRQFRRTSATTIIAAALCAGMSSIAILPLLEFLPLTERAADLPTDQLLEFSYPLSHAITLFIPYFFGDHHSYWGAKGYQELAAFIGIIPYLLAVFALTTWRQKRPLRITGAILLTIGGVFALGRYSPLYRFLIENHIITTLNIPGRFVFFAVTGVLFLAVIGLHDLLQPAGSRKHRIWQLIITSVSPLLIILPLLWQTLNDPRIGQRLAQLVRTADVSLLLSVFGYGYVVILLFIVARRGQPMTARTQWMLTGLASLTLLIYGFNYNPVIPRQAANQHLAFVPYLTEYTNHHGYPARLYSRPQLLTSTQNAQSFVTEPISPAFSVVQPLGDTRVPLCLTTPLHTTGTTGTLMIGLHKHPTGPALETHSVTAASIDPTSDYAVCFNHPAESGQRYYVSFTANESSSIQLSYKHTDVPSAYLIRVVNATDEQIKRSQKNVTIDIRLQTQHGDDTEGIMLARHLNVIANTSSARWIGALSIQSYRDFIEMFFANDRDEYIDGEGIHVIKRHRSLVDATGITHLIQEIPDGVEDYMSKEGYTVLAEQKLPGSTVRLYTNPTAFPKAFLVPTAIFRPAADETRTAMLEDSFDPKNTVYISGPTPPQANMLEALSGPGDSSVRLNEYESTYVSATVSTPHGGWLVVNDSSTPEWEAYVDNERQPYFVANTFMKTAYVPAGEHEVQFIYHSPAADRASYTALISLLITVACLTVPWPRRDPKTA